MRVAIRNLSVLAYAQGFTLWHCKAAAASLADVVADGYFDPASDMLAVGDMLMISAMDAARVVFVSKVGQAGGNERVVVAALA